MVLSRMFLDITADCLSTTGDPPLIVDLSQSGSRMIFPFHKFGACCLLKGTKNVEELVKIAIADAAICPTTLAISRTETFS